MLDLIKNYNYLAKAIKPMYQLARLDKPIGFLLLMWPCLWSYVYGSIIFSYNIEIIFPESILQDDNASLHIKFEKNSLTAICTPLPHLLP